MKIKCEDEQYHQDKKEEEITDYIQSKIDGSDYDRGQIETISATSLNCAEALGNLIDILRQKDILTDKDIHKIVEEIY
ncbi:MAG: hypothetical protein GY870_04640 [archaeon]|nr:hypothetical protein [archaeon]